MKRGSYYVHTTDTLDANSAYVQYAKTKNVSIKEKLAAINSTYYSKEFVNFGYRRESLYSTLMTTDFSAEWGRPYEHLYGKALKSVNPDGILKKLLPENDVTGAVLIDGETFNPLSNERRLFTVPNSIGGFSTTWYPFYSTADIKDDSYTYRINDEVPSGSLSNTMELNFLFDADLHFPSDPSGNDTFTFDIINHTDKPVTAKIKIKPLCKTVSDVSAYMFNNSGYNSTLTYAIDHSHGIRIKCGNRKCRIRAMLCMSNFDPTTEDYSSNNCKISYQTQDIHYPDIPEEGAVLVPSGTNFGAENIFTNELFFDQATPPYNSKLFTGKLVACHTNGDLPTDPDEDIFTIEPNVSW